MLLVRCAEREGVTAVYPVSTLPSRLLFSWSDLNLYECLVSSRRLFSNDYISRSLVPILPSPSPCMLRPTIMGCASKAILQVGSTGRESAAGRRRSEKNEAECLLPWTLSDVTSSTAVLPALCGSDHSFSSILDFSFLLLLISGSSPSHLLSILTILL